MKSHYTENSKFPPMDSLLTTAPLNTSFLYKSIFLSFVLWTCTWFVSRPHVQSCNSFLFPNKPISLGTERGFYVPDAEAATTARLLPAVFRWEDPLIEVTNGASAVSIFSVFGIAVPIPTVDFGDTIVALDINLYYVLLSNLDHLKSESGISLFIKVIQQS